MANFYETVLTVLKSDERFVAEDGTFLRNAVYEAAMKMDEGLIRLLLANDETRTRFFVEVDGVKVFDKMGFAWVINNRQTAGKSPEDFKKLISSELTKQNGLSQAEIKKEISSAQKRTDEIDQIIKALYEDKVKGNISLEIFQKLSSEYCSEQKSLTAKILDCNKKIADLGKTKEAMKGFFDVVDRYCTKGKISELTKEIVEDFIDHIVISKEKKADGKRQPEIYFRGIGLLSEDVLR